MRQHAPDRVVNLLPVCDAGKGRVLAADKDAGVAEDEVEKGAGARG